MSQTFLQTSFCLVSVAYQPRLPGTARASPARRAPRGQNQKQANRAGPRGARRHSAGHGTMPNSSIPRQRATTFVGIGAPAVAPRHARAWERAATWPARIRGVAAIVASRGAVSPCPTPLRGRAIARSVPCDRVRPTRSTPQSTGSVSVYVVIFASEPSAQPQLNATAGFFFSGDPGFGSRSAGGAALLRKVGRR